MAITEPDLFCPTQQGKTLRHWGLHQRASLFARQPSEETGEQISHSPPWRQGAWGVYGINSKEAGRSEAWGVWGKVIGKSAVIVLLRHN